MLLNVYSRYNVIFEKGEGSYIFDIEGNKYFKSLLQRASIRAGKKTYRKQCNGESIFYEQWNRSN